MCMQTTTKTSEELRNAIAQSLSHISTTTTLNCNSNLTMEWQALSSALRIASQSTLGNMERRHQDWFNDNATEIRSLIHNKNAAHDALLRNPTSRTLRERFSSKFLPFCTPMMLPFPALLLTDFSVVSMSCLKRTSVQAL